MKIKLLTTLLLISINIIFSQEKVIKLNDNETLTIDDTENGKIVNGIYSCNEFDWKIKIPENYNITDVKKLEEIEQKGNDELKKSLPESVQIQSSTHLIGFNLDAMNTFSASFSPLDKTYKITLEEHKKQILQLLNQSYSTIKNAKFEFTTTNIKIGKYEFYKIKVKGYNTSNNQLVLTQIYYNSIIREHLFGILISYNNEKQGHLLENNFLNSIDK